ncbi:uncharacterized protein LOC133792001 [Humulus lupulus]|uniref:uncharacterized protein LOC133792001 n=1 Tax=Humulus lupulus TaxID=3486 RepID=UPI002B40EA84|nr:uncharacterized protein LOC133792001 [Humulus lupulus]
MEVPQVCLYDPCVNDDPVGNFFEDNDDVFEDDSHYGADVSNEDVIEKTTTKLSTLVEADVSNNADRGRFMNVYTLGQFEFHVTGADSDLEVNLMTKSCSCGVFQLIGIPCPHAAAAAIACGVNLYSLCSSFYTIKSWRNSYKETIYPTGNEDDWILLDDIKNMVVGVPIGKQQVGRPKKPKLGRPRTNCWPSSGEKDVKMRKCSRCGGHGHNKSSCKAWF